MNRIRQISGVLVILIFGCLFAGKLLLAASDTAAPPVLPKFFDSSTDLNSADEEDKEPEFTRCKECHNYSAKEIEKQKRLPRKKHRRALKENKPCSDCHDSDEIAEICCHDEFIRW